MSRGLLAPKDRIDRVLYVLVALTGPRTAIWALQSGEEDLRFAGLVFVGWSAIAAFYTVAWALASYRRWAGPRQGLGRRL